MSDRIEHWGDEGQLHIAQGWTISRREVCEWAEDYIRSSGEPDISEFMQDVRPENVRRGWAIEIPSHDDYPSHPLHRGLYDEGSIVLGSMFRPPFFIYRDSRRLHLLIPKPVTWLRDH